MTVGLHLAYQRSDECFMALQLARTVEQCGHHVQILPAGKPGQVDLHWDGRVLRGGRKEYTDWVTDLSHVVFCNVPPVELVLAAQNFGVKAVLLAQWADLTESDLRCVTCFDKVIAPSRAVYKHFRNCGSLDAANVVCVPWDVCSPFTRSDHVIDPARVGVAWNLDGSQPFVSNTSSLDTLKELLKLPFVFATVLHTSRLGSPGLEVLRELHQTADGRLELVKNPSWERKLLTLAAHDFTMWPSLTENAGLTGLMSLTVGTPVLAYDHPVCGEIVKDGVNGALVPCELEYNWFGVPSAVPNEPSFLEAATKLAGAPRTLAELRQRVHHKLDKRRLAFRDLLATIFEP